MGPYGDDVWILDRYDWSREMTALCQALRQRGLKADIVDWGCLTPGGNPAGFLKDGVPCAVPKAALVESRVYTRHTEGDLSLVYDWLDALAAEGTRLCNPASAIRTARNKLRQAAILSGQGLPVPPTAAVRSQADLERCLADWGDVVIKPVVGHASIDVTRMRADGPGAADGSRLGLREEIVSWHLLQEHHVLLAQPYVANPGRDLRIAVIGDSVAACVYHVSTAPDLTVRHFLYPLRWEKAPLTTELRDIALGATAALGLHIAVLDLLEGPDGPVIIEVNCSGSVWSRIEGTEMDLTEHGMTSLIADHLAALASG
jgi:tetrahydromethanopterin:alpha-L-glutamate ligase